MPVPKLRLTKYYKRCAAPENDDVVLAARLARNNGTIFWALRAAAGLALAVDSSHPTDPVITARVQQVLSHLQELEVVRC